MLCRTPGPDARERKSELTIEVVCFQSQRASEPASSRCEKVGVRESHAWSGVSGQLS